jgi:hypothetical protein
LFHLPLMTAAIGHKPGDDIRGVAAPWSHCYHSLQNTENARPVRLFMRLNFFHQTYLISPSRFTKITFSFTIFSVGPKDLRMSGTKRYLYLILNPQSTLRNHRFKTYVFALIKFFYEIRIKLLADEHLLYHTLMRKTTSLKEVTSLWRAIGSRCCKIKQD